MVCTSIMEYWLWYLHGGVPLTVMEWMAKGIWKWNSSLLSLLPCLVTEMIYRRSVLPKLNCTGALNSWTVLQRLHWLLKLEFSKENPTASHLHHPSSKAPSACSYIVSVPILLTPMASCILTLHTAYLCFSIIWGAGNIEPLGASLCYTWWLDH